MTRMLNAVVERCVPQARRSTLSWAWWQRLVAALAIVLNGLGSDAIGVDQAGWVGKVAPDFARASA